MPEDAKSSSSEEERRAFVLHCARQRGEQMGQHEFHSSTMHPFPSRDRMERKIRGWLIAELELTPLDQERIAACYDGARDSYERLRSTYREAAKKNDYDTVRAIEAERAAHNNRIRKKLFAPEDD